MLGSSRDNVPIHRLKTNASEYFARGTFSERFIKLQIYRGNKKSERDKQMLPQKETLLKNTKEFKFIS